MIHDSLPQPTLCQTLVDLRALQVQGEMGATTEREYSQLFRELDAQTGLPCADCGRKPAVMIQDKRPLCSCCALIVIKVTRHLLEVV